MRTVQRKDAMTIPAPTLLAWKELSERATPGEWLHRQVICNGEVRYDTVRGPEGQPIAYDSDSHEADFIERDAAFIAASRTAVPALLAEVWRLQLGMGALDVELNRQRIMAKGHLAEIARLKSLCREACDLADTAARFLSPLYRSKFYRRDGARIAAIRQEVAGE
jgi:hypothetical protein